MDLVFQSKSPLFITRKDSEDMVMMSKSDYDSLNETLYLLGSSKNAERLSLAKKELEEEKTVSFTLDELEKLGK